MKTNTDTLIKQVILVGGSNKKHVIRSSDIIYIEAQDNYCMVYLQGNEKILVTKSLQDCQKELAAEIFFRCHRSYLISLVHVKEICRFRGRTSLLLKNGINIEIARRRAKEFKSFFNLFVRNNSIQYY